MTIGGTIRTLLVSGVIVILILHGHGGINANNIIRLHLLGIAIVVHRNTCKGEGLLNLNFLALPLLLEATAAHILTNISSHSRIGG